MNFIEANSTLASIVRANGRVVRQIQGARKTKNGYLEATHNLKLIIYEIDSEDEALYFVEVSDNGGLREFVMIEIKEGHDLAEAVTAYLLSWDQEWVEAFYDENII
jgi:hypothetical protein